MDLFEIIEGIAIGKTWKRYKNLGNIPILMILQRQNQDVV